LSEISTSLTTALSDRYRIQRELGQGGMATVYLAEDLKHHRKVAIKVLRPELAAVIGAERFVREIQTIAALQHPHILGLIDSGEASGTAYYVMPFVEGESLRTRITRDKQLSINDAVRIATEVATALDYAHRHGVIHRDIKPENILLHDGSALVADFGIALAVSQAGGSRMTETGMSLGTPHYMSPEQAMGEREISNRSDLYALGAVTYEMLLGEPPFSGPTAQSIFAKVLTEEPRRLIPKRHTIPAHVEGAVLTALEKLPADRFASAAEFSDALNGRAPTTTRPGTAQLGTEAKLGVQRRVLAAFLLGAGLATVGTVLWASFRSQPARQSLSLSVLLPKGEGISLIDAGTRIALSPDGTRLAYVGPGEGGGRVWLRRLDQLHATPIPGTDGARSPFFSPDGEQLGFFSGSLQVLSLTGGPPTVLGDTGLTQAGGAWSPDGWIYFDQGSGIARISVRDRAREMIYQMDSTAGEQGVAWPSVLPDGKTLLFRLRHDQIPSNFDVVAMKLPDGRPKVVVRALYACYSPPGHLLYVTSDGTLFSAPFDEEKLSLSGTPVRVATGVNTGAFGAVDLAVSENGLLTYTAGGAFQSFVGQVPMWVDREGNATPVDTSWHLSAPLQSLALSPDGSALAVEMQRGINGVGTDIWIRRLDTGTLSRLTFDRIWNSRPSWTPSGREVAFVSADNTQYFGEIRVKRADGTGSDTLLASSPGLLTDATFSADGRWLLVRSPAVSQTGANIGAMRRDRPDSIHWILDSRFTETTPALSPDGRWLAYASNETGIFEVYVRPFPEVSSAKWQVSSAGGIAPLWAHSGRKLFYVSGGDLAEVDVRPGPQFSASPQRRLFSLERFAVDPAHAFYAVSPNDQRLFMYGSTQAQEASELILVQNWTQLLGKR
jgi:eukaryotic-like serine/threonine-protein kinase